MSATNWPNPEQPGVVMWPDKDGQHLFALGGGYIVAFWRADKQWLVCDDDHELGFCASERVKDLHYIGPCLTPAQIAEMLAGEQERCAKVCDAARLPDFSMPEQWHNNGCEHCAHDICNLGEAP